MQSAFIKYDAFQCSTCDSGFCCHVGKSTIAIVAE
ncbi:MAG: hypothetical protein WAM86_20770 [Candidatus Sulfotelmatobacter sp.]